VESSFLDELAGRRLTEEEKEERALEDEIRKEDEEIEKELGLENRSFGIVRRGWK
jgi:transcriptional regulator of met regulon